MTGDLFDDLEQIAEQSSFLFNEGHRKRTHAAKIGRLSVSPGLRAKVSRPRKDSPAALRRPPKAIPERDVPAPTVPRVIANKDELLDLIKRRREELNISHSTVDALTGWADGLSSKYLSDPPIRGFAGQSLELILGALALGIARVEFVEDPDAVKRMSGRWKPRKRNRSAE